jgi:Protein O-mannosyl-transferase TMEM260-like
VSAEPAPAGGGQAASVRATGGRTAVARAAAPVGVGLVALVLARAALLPGLAFWDTGEFQAVGPLLGTAHPTGYPAFVLLGWLASIVFGPLGEPAFRLNLLAAVLFAVASGLTVVLVRELTGHALVAVGSGLLLALSPLVWRMGTHADPHTLHLALVALLLVLLVGWENRHAAQSPGSDRWLVAAAGVSGVAAANHSLSLLLAPAVVLYVLAVDPRIVLRPRLWLGCLAIAAGVALLLYLELPVRAAMGAPLVYGRPDTWEGFAYVVTAEQFRGDVLPLFADLGRKVADLAQRGSAELGLLAPLVPAAFFATILRRPRYALVSGLAFAITCLFDAAYVNAAIDRYYLGPVLLAISWLGVGVAAVADAVVPRGARAASPAVIVAGLVGLAVLVGPALLAAPLSFRQADRSGDVSARRWVDGTLATLPEDALVQSWWSFSTPLWYATLVEGRRPDVTVVDDRDLLDENLGTVDDVIEANLGRRPVFVLRPDAEIVDLARRWVLERWSDPAGIQPLWQVVARRGTESRSERYDRSGAGPAACLARAPGGSRPRASLTAADAVRSSA